MGDVSRTWLISVVVTLALAGRASAQGPETQADTALIVAVDVSQSVDDERYRFQMEGIAQALEDPAVVSAIAGGPNGGILFSLVTWADQTTVAIDWRRIGSQEEAAGVASVVRALPRQRGEFTCIARLFRTVAQTILPKLPAPVTRVVVDVSGDGIDNCSPPRALRSDRESLVALGATINGLPIFVAGENDVVGSGAYRAPGFGLSELSIQPDRVNTTLDSWFRVHVIGGPGAFIHPAQGYADFGRALRQKFLMEISGLDLARLSPSGR